MSNIPTFAGRILLVRTGTAIGDALLLTAVAEEISREFPNISIAAAGRYPCLFLNNPHIKRSFQLPFFFPSKIAPYLRVPGIRFLGYEFGDFPPTEHLAVAFCKSAGLSPTGIPRPRIYLSDQECFEGRRRFELPREFVAIQSIAGSSWAANNKDWDPKRWQEAVNQLASEIAFVQIGLATDPPLKNAIDLRGKTSLREVAYILRQSTCFIGQEGGLHHMAAAVDTPSVLVLSGYILPETTSYPENVAIYHGAECAPCWLTTPCPYSKKCLATITVKEVVNGIRTVLDRKATQCKSSALHGPGD